MSISTRRVLVGAGGMTAAIVAAGALVTAGTASASVASPARPQAHQVRLAPQARQGVRARQARQDNNPDAPGWLVWPTVKFGDMGNRVFAIQYLLRAWGYSVGPSGVFGGITRHDVAHFQHVRGLRGTGVVGTATWDRLVILVARGSRGNAVAGVQQNLRYGYGYKNLSITGFFGPVTRADVRNFQARYHIGVDGIVGPITWNTLIRNEK